MHRRGEPYKPRTRRCPHRQTKLSNSQAQPQGSKKTRVGQQVIVSTPPNIKCLRRHAPSLCSKSHICKCACVCPQCKCIHTYTPAYDVSNITAPVKAAATLPTPAKYSQQYRSRCPPRLSNSRTKRITCDIRRCHHNAPPGYPGVIRVTPRYPGVPPIRNLERWPRTLTQRAPCKSDIRVVRDRGHRSKFRVGGALWCKPSYPMEPHQVQMQHKMIRLVILSQCRQQLQHRM
jgi:hypothetical protein